MKNKHVEKWYLFIFIYMRCKRGGTGIYFKAEVLPFFFFHILFLSGHDPNRFYPGYWLFYIYTHTKSTCKSTCKARRQQPRAVIQILDSQFKAENIQFTKQNWSFQEFRNKKCDPLCFNLNKIISITFDKYKNWIRTNKGEFLCYITNSYATSPIAMRKHHKFVYIYREKNNKLNITMLSERLYTKKLYNFSYFIARTCSSTSKV